MNQLLEKILLDTYTIADLSRRTRILRGSLNNRIFGGQENQEEQLSYEDQRWLNNMTLYIHQTITKDNFRSIFEQIEKEKDLIKPLIIYTPLEFDNNEVINLGIWLRQSYGRIFMIELRLDPSLIAGCALVWKGKYKDYSIKSKISSSSKEIFKSFKNYLK